MKEWTFEINQDAGKVSAIIENSNLHKRSLVAVADDGNGSAVLTIGLPKRLASVSDVPYFVQKKFPAGATFKSFR
jgi:hypothetical protein